VFTTGWYEPALLVLKGRALNTDAVIDVQWDSGAGYNSYEQEQFRFLPTRSGSKKMHQIVISGGGAKNSLSKNNCVVLAEIRTDDKGLPIPTSALHSIRYVRGAGWFF